MWTCEECKTEFDEMPGKPGTVILIPRDVRTLADALRRALEIIDNPHYRDAAGMRPSSNPAVDEIRAVLANQQ